MVSLYGPDGLFVFFVFFNFFFGYKIRGGSFWNLWFSVRSSSTWGGRAREGENLVIFSPFLFFLLPGHLATIIGSGWRIISASDRIGLD